LTGFAFADTEMIIPTSTANTNTNTWRSLEAILAFAIDLKSVSLINVGLAFDYDPKLSILCT